ncbi:protein MAINTENANCE OF MERISTEMS-like [Lotus japonicus]|uniref:protein MAINTENANCE OF MERISTEMS-like n=1 Tax=Lotus japonicus TaxID=34305 RepID=UPI00258647BA|nr:protein MAINTENANCE OF MERISTEMS-like [Lotus japonicus]
MYAARAYILRLIGTFLLCDHTGSHVPLRYLILLRDFEETAKYSWGSAVLALLYHELCYATGASRTEIGGCAYLIQVWAWLRIPGIGPDPPRLHRGLPLAARWRDPDPKKPIKWAKKQIEWWRTKLDECNVSLQMHGPSPTFEYGTLVAMDNPTIVIHKSK